MIILVYIDNIYHIYIYIYYILSYISYIIHTSKIPQKPGRVFGPSVQLRNLLGATEGRAQPQQPHGFPQATVREVHWRLSFLIQAAISSCFCWRCGEKYVKNMCSYVSKGNCSIFFTKPCAFFLNEGELGICVCNEFHRDLFFFTVI